MVKYYMNNKEYDEKTLMRFFHTKIQSYSIISNTLNKEINVNQFFKKIKHNNNDITYKYNYITQENEKHNLPYMIKDNYGRIVNSDTLKEIYLSYNLNNLYNIKIKKIKKYEFRKGSVPFIHHWKKSFNRYKGNHGSTTQELREYFNTKKLNKEIKAEYNLLLKVRRSQSFLNTWNDDNLNFKGRGWKRTRKQKQWMKSKGYTIPTRYNEYYLNSINVDYWEIYEEENYEKHV